MIEFFRQLLRPRAERQAPMVPPGERIYAIGDVHGRSDLFSALIRAIDADDAASTPSETTIILLGDLVDRGSDSAGVIAAARAWGQRRKVRYLIGNHEEWFMSSLTDETALRGFLRMGGRETILSYPVDRTRFARADMAAAQDLIRDAVPEDDLAFLQSGENHIEIGDYLFVHAGIRPGVALEDQAVADLRWIRGDFTGSSVQHPWCVVHGHSITDEVDLRPNRIGIDTGAYYSGRLTALRLEGADQAILQTTHGDDGIAVDKRSIA